MFDDSPGLAGFAVCGGRPHFAPGSWRPVVNAVFAVAAIGRDGAGALLAGSLPTPISRRERGCDHLGWLPDHFDEQPWWLDSLGQQQDLLGHQRPVFHAVASQELPGAGQRQAIPAGLGDRSDRRVVEPVDES
jgi:hypothetical protein